MARKYNKCNFEITVGQSNQEIINRLATDIAYNPKDLYIVQTGSWYNTATGIVDYNEERYQVLPNLTYNMINPYKELENYLNIKIEDDYKKPDFIVEETYTADDYSIWSMRHAEDNITLEENVYYYEPSSEEILKAIKDLKNYENDYIHEVFISDLDSLLSEDEVENWLNNEKGYTKEK